MEIKPEDIQVTTFNTTGSAFASCYNGVEISHIPSGITVREVASRSTRANKAAAMEKLEVLVEAYSLSKEELSEDLTNIHQSADYQAGYDAGKQHFLNKNYNGNGIRYWHDKATAYSDTISDLWKILEESQKPSTVAPSETRLPVSGLTLQEFAERLGKAFVENLNRQTRSKD